MTQDNAMKQEKFTNRCRLYPFLTTSSCQFKIKEKPLRAKLQ